jgi:serine/threonine protein kinase
MLSSAALPALLVNERSQILLCRFAKLAFWAYNLMGRAKRQDVFLPGYEVLALVAPAEWPDEAALPSAALCAGWLVGAQRRSKECGSAMISSPYCPKCGGKNEPGAEACFACGESLAAAPVSFPAAPTRLPRITRKLPFSNLIIKQRYQLVKRVGEGGFGAVYQAEDLDLGNRLVAVKEMSYSGLLATQEFQEATEAFRREAILLAGLAHPSLPRIYDHFSEDGHWYLVMEFIHGETLEKRLERSSRKHLSVRETLQLGIKLTEVLEYLHTRQPPIIFRDLKPSNVMLTPDGSVYLIDFGIARLFKPGQQKDTTSFGTSGYAAPEQYGKAQTTPRSDIFSLGALLHHLVTGNDPSDTPFRFAPLTMPRPTGLGTFIGQMVSLDEYKRPPNMSVVRRELERLAAAWDERQRRQTSTMAFPPYQTATGFLPAVPRYPPGPAPTQAGPHWLPPPTAAPARPSVPMPSSLQPTGMIRSAGPAYPYPAPSMAPMPPSPARRRWFAGWRLHLFIPLVILLLFVACMVFFALTAHGQAPAQPMPVPH